MGKRVSSDQSAQYQIRVKGLLDPKWASWFDGFSIENKSTETILTGRVTDQAALHGILARIRDLGLPILGVNRFENNLFGREKNIKILIVFLAILGGLAVFVFGSPYYSIFPTNGNKTYYLLITIFFLIASILLKKNQTLSKYGAATYSFFSASLALLFLSTGVLNLHDPAMSPLLNLALDKFSQFLHVVPILVGSVLLAGCNLKSIFIRRGRLKQGLIFGLFSLASFAAISFLMGVQSSGFFTSFWDAIPLVFLFIFSNAIMEELWFRGIFLKNYEAIIGRKAAINVTALVFGASHINATYAFPGGGVVFGLVVFGLGLVGAHAMLKDDSLIGPVLFHAGYDLLVIVPALNSI